MTVGDQLKAIARLKLSDGLDYADYHDVGVWCDICGPHYDTTLISDKSHERIRAIFLRFFFCEEL